MAVTYDAVGPSAAGQGQGSGATLAWSHTVGAGVTAGVILIGYSFDLASDAGVTASCTVDGNATNVASLGKVESDAATAGFLQVWAATGSKAGPGAHSISITATSSAADSEGGSISFDGYTGLAAPVTNSGTSITASCSVTAASSSMICGFVATGDTINSSANTSRFIKNQTGSGGNATGNCAGSTAAGTGSPVTVSWSLSASIDPWAVLAVEVQGAVSIPFTATPGSADGAGAAQDATGAAGAATSALYAGSATGISGSWSNTGNATGSTQGTYATWTDSAAGSSAALELATFGAQAAVPAGSAVTQVNCTVRHGEAPAAAVASVTAQAYSGTTPVGSPQALTAADAVHDDQVTFTGLAWADLADLRVRVTVTRN